jgi:hypothetical protein
MSTDENRIEGSSSPTSRGPMTRKVRFCPCVHMRLIPLTTAYERQSLWYQKRDIAIMIRRDMLLHSWNELRMKTHPILIRMQASEEWCARGLENHSPERSFLRKQKKLQGLLAVLLEQLRQFRESLLLDSDAQDLIAARYKIISTECQDAAHKQGLLDEEAARALREDVGTNTCSGVTSKQSKDHINYSQTRTSTVPAYLAVAPCAA